MVIAEIAFSRTSVKAERGTSCDAAPVELGLIYSRSSISMSRPMELSNQFMKTGILLSSILAASGFIHVGAENLKTVDDFKAAADKAKAALALPEWEHTPEAVDAMTR